MKKHDTIATRLSIILNKFNSGERFGVDDLVEEFGVTKRTIQRDLTERLSYLPIKKEKKLYYLEEYYLGKLNFNDIENFAILSGIKKLYPTLKEGFLKDILDDTISKAYLIKGHNYEDISTKSNEFKIIKNAILSSLQLEFIYNNKPRIVSPYKLLNKNGIWYLIAIENNGVKTFSFQKIAKLNQTKQTFEVEQNVIDTITNDDNTWYGNDQIEVTLQVNKEVASYFKRRKILPNQIILEQLDDRALIVSCKVSFDEEILKLVRYWIPNVQIITPLYLKEKLNNSLKDFLKI